MSGGEALSPVFGGRLSRFVTVAANGVHTGSVGSELAGSGLGGAVDVVIVSWNSAEPLAGCIASLVGDLRGSRLEADRVGPERIVVVDNASSDDSAAVALRLGVAVLETGANLGFGRAANRAMAATAAPYVLLLNADTVIQPGAMLGLRRTLDERPDVAIAGPRIYTLDGQLYPSTRAFPSLGAAIGHGFVGLVRPSNRWSQRYLRPSSPDWVAGTAMMIRRSAFEAVGGFDETYFMYAEDVDLCWRLRKAGWAIAVADDAEIQHTVGASSEQRPYRMIVEHHRSLWRFARRSTAGPPRLLLPVVAAGLVARAMLAVVRRLLLQRAPANH